MMSEDNSDEMRPIPDGGLKDAMPGWLMRPPAWRSMPTAEERHERTLPEPDTSTIDPKTLVDVDDLPAWLQTIAARGDIPIPQPDDVTHNAVHHLQVVQAPEEREAIEMHLEIPDSVVQGEGEAIAPDRVRTGALEEKVTLATDEPLSLPSRTNDARMLTWGLVASGVIIIILLIVIAVL